MNLADRTERDALRASQPSAIRGALRRAHASVVIYLGLLAFGLGCLIWSGLSVPLTYLLSKDQGRLVGRRVNGYGFRFSLWVASLTGVLSFDLRALDALRGAGPLIIAPNHPSLLDAAMVISRLPDATCVMKAKLIDNPIYGASARLADYIRNDDFIGAATQAVRVLEGGGQLLLFPEGTRTTRPPLNSLKGGAVLVSKRSGAPIQTVLFETNSPFLSKPWPLYRIPPVPICFRARLGRRFAPPEDLRAAVTDLEAYLASELNRSGAFAATTETEGARGSVV